ncbi:MAG TPA: lmo0937 family membrane protein [Thermomicrobiales bacterium]|nr:lmo0937 family membrane protein [Thermomicrobiales bacterium]
MLFIIAAVLVVLWLVGWLAFHVAGAFIHLILIVALIVIIVQLLQGRRSAS